MISRLSKLPILNSHLRLTALTLLASGSLLAPLNPSFAQSNGGLQLGQPEAPANTLDLGAGPVAPAVVEPSIQSGGLATAKPSAGGPAAKLTTHGDWEVACDGSGSNCAMAQIGNDSSGTPILEMVIRSLAEPLEVGERTAIAVLDVITPLGVVLTEGLGVTIDGGRQESAPFQICTEQGCLVREPVDSDLINRLKRGNTVAVSVIAANQGKVSANLSLAGFTKAFDSLK